PGPAAPSTVLPGGRAAVCHAVLDWLVATDAAAPRTLLITGPPGAGKTFTLAWAASELAVLAEEADDERFAWVSARGLTPRVLAWQLAGQLGVTVAGARELGPALGARLRGNGVAGSGSGAPVAGSGFGPGVAAEGDGVAVGFAAGAVVDGDLSGRVNGAAGGGSTAEQGDGEASVGEVGELSEHTDLGVGLGVSASGGAAAGEGSAGRGPAPGAESVGAAAAVEDAERAEAELPFAARANLPGSRSATWDVLASSAAATYEVGRWSRVTILISEVDLAGHLRDGSARAAVISELVAPLVAVPGVRVIVESRGSDLPGPMSVIDLGESRWTDKAEFAAWLDDLVPSGGAAAPQAYPNPSKAREILSLAVNRHAGLLAASDERPWKLAAVPFDVAFREGIADQIVLEPANLVLVQQPALSTAIDALGAAVAPGTRAAWRVAGQALTNAAGVPERAAILHGAALAVGDHALAEAVAPYTRGTRPSDGASVGEPTPWLTRWAGWRPLPPDTPRPTPWPGPVAALAVAQAIALTEPVPGSEEVAADEAADEAAAGGDDAPQPIAEAPAEPAEPYIPSAQRATIIPGPIPAPAVTPADLPAEFLVAIDDLARAYRLDPRDGRIVGRPAAPVMVKARTAAVVDPAPSLVLTDASRRLAALGPGAPRGVVSAVREVLPDTAVTAVAVAREALVFGAGDGRVHVWDAVTEELVADPEDQHSGAVTAVAAIWMPDVDILFALSGGLDGTFRLWAVPADASLLPVEDRGVPVTAVTAAITEVGPVAAVGWADGHVTVWDLAEARTGRPIPLGWAPKALALGSDGLLVAACEDGLMAIDVQLRDFFEA
ncbi:MAG: hypothetical protein HOW97_25220, partial [Catenulispora sp.]|nr:hypothetical protein [Catenulispora sp.]